MKKFVFWATMMLMSIGAYAMPIDEAQREALYLTDKMAYELGLDEYQFEAVYEINLDYFLSCITQTDVYGPWWERRNADLQYVLTPTQFYRYTNRLYFYRPLTWRTGAWYYPIYTHYPNRTHYYRTRPVGYGLYMGGNNRLGHDYYANRPPVGRAGHGTPQTQPNGYNHGYGNNNGYGNTPVNSGRNNGFNQQTNPASRANQNRSTVNRASSRTTTTVNSARKSNNSRTSTTTTTTTSSGRGRR